jgi:hypothetical protein
MKVDIGVQEFLAEGVDFTGVTLRDRAVAQVFAHEGAVLGLSWLQVLGSTKLSQINESEGHQFEPKMSNLESLKT